MVKMIALVKRNPDLSEDEFHRMWREEHGPLIRESSLASKYVVRYEQNHCLPAERVGGDPPYDGAAIMWFRELDDFWAMVADPEYQAEIAPDENRLLDLPATVVLFTDEAEPFIEP